MMQHDLDFPKFPTWKWGAQVGKTKSIDMCKDLPIFQKRTCAKFPSALALMMDLHCIEDPGKTPHEAKFQNTLGCVFYLKY